MKHILKLSDLGKEDVVRIIDRAFELKQAIKSGQKFTHLQGKTLGMIFNKPSTRTRLSFESAMVQLGGTPLFMSAKDTQISRNEPVKDTARVMSRYLDILAIRTYSQGELEELAYFSEIPVVNALTDMFHPCQILSDLMTVVEHKGRPKNQKIAWIGDGNNVCQSWVNIAGVLGLELRIACPHDYWPDQQLVDEANDKGAKITLTVNPVEAVQGADVINTDVWASMGHEGHEDERRRDFAAYQINAALLKEAAPHAIVLHCLPAHRGEEITDDVLEGSQSVVWDQAENKMHLHRAVIDVLIADSEDRKARGGIEPRKDGGPCDNWCDG